MELDADYWSQRYQQAQTGWDLGQASPAIRAFFEAENFDKNIKILIPGAGNAHEAAYLWAELGFERVYLCDWAKEPLEAFQEKYPNFPAEQILHLDFFKLEGPFDLILEQTFFCALDPSLRPNYAAKMAELLGPRGRLEGLLFGCFFEQAGPPFGGSSSEYFEYFESYFRKIQLLPCFNSIAPRAGRELWLSAEK